MCGVFLCLQAICVGFFFFFLHHSFIKHLLQVISMVQLHTYTLAAAPGLLFILGICEDLPFVKII